MSELTFYWNIGSQPSRAVKTLIDIGKIPCTLKPVKLMKLQQKSEEFLKMYPLGKVPVLKDGDYVLGESGAIMVYLCQRYPNLIKYYGQTIEERAIVNMYVSWYQNYFRPFLLSPLRIYMQSIASKKPIHQNQRKILFKGMFDVIEKLNELLLRNRTKFIAGDKVTIADFLFYYEMTNLVYFGLDHDAYKQVKRWYELVYQIPQVKSLTHQWYQSAKKMVKFFQNVEIIKPKL